MLSTTQAQVIQNRLTATGFTLALSALAVVLVLKQQAAGGAAGYFESLAAVVSLFAAFVLALFAMSLFLWAGELDPKGTVSLMPTGCGEIALFIAMAKLLEGAVGHLLLRLDDALTQLPILLGEASPDMVSVGLISTSLSWSLGLLALIAWVWLLYILPLRVIFREAFTRLAKLGLVLFLVLMLGTTFLLGAQAQRVQSVAQGADPGLWSAVGHQALLPLEFLD